MVRVLKVKGPLSGKEYLEARMLRVIDLTTNTTAQAVDNTRTYCLRLRVMNTYKNNLRNNRDEYDDKWGYYNTNLRVVPKTKGIQIYSSPNFQTPFPRFETMIDELREQEGRWYSIYFKWTEADAKDVNDLKFSIGLYTHEELMVKNWSDLSP